MTKDPKPFDFCVITWEDAYTCAGDQYDNIELAFASYKPMIRRSVGLWVGKDERVHILATDDDRSSTVPHAIGGLSYIPTGMVRGVEIIPKPPKEIKNVRKRS